MPVYDYLCQHCGRQVELVHGVHAPGPERCEHCGSGPMRKVLAPPAIHFKGTGWAKKERAASRAKSPTTGDAATAGEAAPGAAPAASDPPAEGTAAAGSAGSSGSSASGAKTARTGEA
jgi:putative FmdB family regulatory protein